MFGIVGGLLNAFTPSVVPGETSRRSSRRSLSPSSAPASPPPANGPSIRRVAGTPATSPAEPSPLKKQSTSKKNVPNTFARSKASKKPPSPITAMQTEADGAVLYKGQDIDKMLCADIKSALKELGLAYQGKKALLAERLKEHIASSVLVISPSPTPVMTVVEEAVQTRSTRRRVAAALSPVGTINKTEAVAKSSGAKPESVSKTTPPRKTPGSRKRHAVLVYSPDENPQKNARTAKSMKAPKAIKITDPATADRSVSKDMIDVDSVPAATNASQPFEDVSESDSERFFEAGSSDPVSIKVNEPAVSISPHPASTISEPIATSSNSAISFPPSSVSGVSLSADLLKLLSEKFESTLRGEGTLTDTEYTMFQLLLSQSRAKPSSVQFAPEPVIYEHEQTQPHVRFQNLEKTTKSSVGVYNPAPTPMPDRSIEFSGAIEKNVVNAGVTPYGKPVSSQRYAGHTPFMNRASDDSIDETPFTVTGTSSSLTPQRVASNGGGLDTRCDSYEMDVYSAERNNPVPEIPSPVPLRGRWSNGSRESPGRLSAGRDSLGLWQSSNWRQATGAESAPKKRDSAAADMNNENYFGDSDAPLSKRQHVGFDVVDSDHKYVSVTEPIKNLRFSMGSVSHPAAYTPSFKVNAAALGRHTGGLDPQSQRKMYPFSNTASGSSPHWPLGRSNFSNSTPLSVKSRAQMLTASASRRKLIRSRLESSSEQTARGALDGGSRFGSTVPAASAVVAKRILETLGEMVTPLEEEKIRHPVSKLYKDSNNFTEKNVEKMATFLQAGEDTKPHVTFAAKDEIKEQPVDHIKSAPEKSNKIDPVPQFGLNKKPEIGNSFLKPAPKFDEEMSIKNNPGVSAVTLSAPPSPPSNSEFRFGNPIPVSGIDENIAGPEAIKLQTRLSGAPGASVKDDKIKFIFSPPAKAPKRTSKQSSINAENKPKVPDAVKATTSGSINDEKSSISAAPSIWNAVSDKVKCESSLVQNDKNATKCVSCETPVTKKAPVDDARTAPSKPPSAPSIWNMVSDKVKCSVCLVQNEKSATKCVSCENPMSADAGKNGASYIPRSSESLKSNSFSFAVPVADPTDTAPSKAPSSVGFTFGSAPTAKSTDTAPEAATKEFSFSSSLGAAPAVPSPAKSSPVEEEKKIGFSFSAPSFGALPSKASSAEVAESFSFSAPSFGIAAKLDTDKKEEPKEKVEERPVASVGFFSGSSFGSFPSQPFSGAKEDKRDSTSQDDNGDKNQKRSRNSDEAAESATPSAPMSSGFSFSAPSLPPPTPKETKSEAPPFSGFSFTAAPASTATEIPTIDSKPTEGTTVPSLNLPATTGTAVFSSAFQFGATEKSAPSTSSAPGAFSFSVGSDSSSKPKDPAPSFGGAPFVFGSAPSQPPTENASSSSLTGGALSSAAKPSPFVFNAVPTIGSSKGVDASSAAPFTFGAATKTADSAGTPAPFVFGATSTTQNSSRVTPPSAFGVSAGSPSGMDYSSGGENSNFTAPQTQAPPMFGSSSTSAPIAGIGMLQNNNSSSIFGGSSNAFPTSGGGPMFGAPSAGITFGVASGLAPAGGSSSNLNSAPVFGAPGASQSAPTFGSGSAAPFVFGAAPVAHQGQPFAPQQAGGIGGMNWGSSVAAPAATPSGGGGMFSMGASGSTNNQPGSGAPRRKLKAKRPGH